MTDLQRFIENHRSGIDGPESVPFREDVAAMLASLGFNSSKELECYLSTYGWLGYKSVEFCGMGDGFSDMRDETVKLRDAWPMTGGYAVLESLSDSARALCDGHGRVFRFDAGTKSLSDLHMQLEEYILSRFMKADKTQ